MKLTSQERNSLSPQTFVFPKTRKFPIPDQSHARNALARAGAQGGAVQSKVRSAVERKFPSIAVKGSMMQAEAKRRMQ